MRKTACPVVWKGHGAQSPCPHPIHWGSAGKTAAYFTEVRGSASIGATVSRHAAIVRGELVGGLGFRSAVGFDEDETSGVVGLLDDIEAGDAGLAEAGGGVGEDGGFEGVDGFGADLDVDVNDEHGGRDRERLTTKPPEYTKRFDCRQARSDGSAIRGAAANAALQALRAAWRG